MTVRLMIPKADTRADYTIVADGYYISVSVSAWFKLRAKLSKTWEISALKDFAIDHGVDQNSVIRIRDQHGKVIFSKQ